MDWDRIFNVPRYSLIHDFYFILAIGFSGIVERLDGHPLNYTSGWRGQHYIEVRTY